MGPLEDEFSLKQAIFHIHGQLLAIKNPRFCFPENGDHVDKWTKIGKTHTHTVLSCGDRWHGNGSFELHVWSIFHEIKVQKTGISQN